MNFYFLFFCLWLVIMLRWSQHWILWVVFCAVQSWASRRRWIWCAVIRLTWSRPSLTAGWASSTWRPDNWCWSWSRKRPENPVRDFSHRIRWKQKRFLKLVTHTPFPPAGASSEPVLLPVLSWFDWRAL